MKRRGTSVWACGKEGPVKTATVPFHAPNVVVNRQVTRTQVARMRTMKNPTTASLPAIRPPKPALPRLGTRPAMAGSSLAAKMKTASINTRKMLGQMTSMQSLADHAMMRARDVKNGSLPTKFKVPLVKVAYPFTPKQELRRRVGACADGVSLKQDNKGWYVATHRARSASYKTVDDIPKAKVQFIASTS